jgi:S1-C subfamily serine protease
MHIFRKPLLVAGLLGGAPLLGVAAEAPPPLPPARTAQPDLERRLEDARRRLEDASRDVAQLSSQLGRSFAFQLQTPDAGPPARALLGVNIDNSSGDTRGARVMDVSPGSAAADAGIKPGDIITSIAGRDLTKEGDPGRALVETMSQVEPNLKLQVAILREGRKLTLDVTPRPAPLAVAGNTIYRGLMIDGNNGRRIEAQPMPFPGGTDRRIEIRTLREGPDDGTRFRGLEFATLSEKLGSYFGVKSGVLVVRAGANAAFKLQDGDVILAIDGREPANAQHAARILRSYSDGEKFRLRVQRDRKAQDIEVTMPGGGPEDRDRQ